MKFYEKILQELRNEEHSFRTIYRYAFSFGDHVYFEQSKNLLIEKITYAQARQEVLRLTAVLQEKAAPGQVIALSMPNSPLWVECFWAILQSGCKALLLSPQLPWRVMEKCLQDTGCRLLLGDIEGCTIPAVGAKELSSARPAHPLADDRKEGWGDEVILATSSTTGAPKLYAFDGKAICAQILNSEFVLKNCRDVARFHHGVIRQLAFLPFSHIFGLTACFLWFTMFGITFVFLKDLQPETILRTCRLHQVTHVFAVPLLWDTMNNRIRKAIADKGMTEKAEKMMKLSLKLQDFWPALGRGFAALAFSSVRKQTLGGSISYCISGGGMLSRETLPLINAIGYPLENGYGMTEIGIACVTVRKPSRRYGVAVGKPLPSLSFNLDEKKQLLVKGKSCYCARYTDGKRIPREEDTWFETGDLFHLEETGDYACISRMDDLVNGANGERISPDAVENEMALPLEHCVFGQGDGTLALMIRLPEQCTVLESAWDKAMAQVQAAIDGLPSYMRPRSIYLSRQALPLSLSGKIRRKAIREGVAAGTYPCDLINGMKRPAAVAEGAGDEALLRQLQEMFARHARCQAPAQPDSHFFTDLGGDSMAFLELITEIETRYTIKITDAISSGMTTPRAACAQVIASLEHP